MKGRQVVLDRVASREAAALLVDGQLDDFLLSPPPKAPPGPGAIFRAIVDRPLKGQGGVIMRLPEGETALFRGAKGLAPGQSKLVMVTTYAETGKAVPVTDRLIFKGRSVIVTPGAPGLNVSRQVRDEELRETLLSALHQSRAPEAGHGVIVRSNAAQMQTDAIAQEADTLLDLANAILADIDGPPELLLDAPGAHDLAWRDWDGEITQEGGFEALGVLDLLPAILDSQVALGSGCLFIESTRAFVAVDINTGSDHSPASGLKANLAAARALPRALRLKGLGGQIVLDPAPMPKKDRRQFEQTLRAAFRADPIETALVGWTPLGHFELQRKRERLPVPPGVFS